MPVTDHGNFNAVDRGTNLPFYMLSANNGYCSRSAIRKSSSFGGARVSSVRHDSMEVFYDLSSTVCFSVIIIFYSCLYLVANRFIHFVFRIILLLYIFFEGFIVYKRF